ncbi:MAG TPA: DUF1611 domain-containing protein [Azospirillaceae bacterium]|nr:DUF1611 domain-containing protein [Azospirillaceae bacterium]
MDSIRKPYLLFLGDVTDRTDAKTALGLRDWAGADVVGQYRMPDCTVDLGIPDLRPAEAAARGARSLVVGIAAVGGALKPSWIACLVEALEAGLDIVSGQHSRLASFPALAEAAGRTERRLIDVRVPPAGLPVGTGRKRVGKRLLTVGTDCALGKKYTALTLARALRDRDVPATFRASGQTGILIGGSGVPIDAVVADFLAGAAETLSPDAGDPNHWDVVEGQGSLFHPGYAAVTLGLLHGSQPDAIVLCHDPRRTCIDGYPDFPIPSLREAIDLYLTLGRLTNPAIRCVGISLNTSGMAEAERQAVLERTAAETGLPCVDPIATGVGAIVERLFA